MLEIIEQPYPPITDYLIRPPVDVMNKELKLYPRMAKFVTWATKSLFESVNVAVDDLEHLKGRNGDPTVMSLWHEGVGDIPVMEMIALKGELGPIRTVSKVEDNMDTFAKRWFNGHLGAVPLKRDSLPWMSAMLNNVDHALQVEQRSVGIFPQGTRGGEEFHDGVLRIAHRSGVPLVPIGIHGTENDIARLKQGNRSTVAVAIGEPRMVTNRKDRVGLEAMMREQKERAVELHDRLTAKID